MDTSGFAVGAVTTGFSYPVVARYSAANGVVTYSDLTDLARGVSFNPQIVVANSNNIFYANNQAAERGTPKFSSGTVGLTVDGLLVPAEQLIMGIPGYALLGALLGATIGATIVFIRCAMDMSPRTAENVTRISGLRVLTVIPYERADAGKQTGVPRQN